MDRTNSQSGAGPRGTGPSGTGPKGSGVGGSAPSGPGPGGSEPVGGVTSGAAGSGPRVSSLAPPDASKRLLPWLVAVAFFMESLDTTILNTAVPAISAALHVGPLSMKAVLASYTLSLAVFIPISGWVADRFGRGGYLPPPSDCSRWDRFCAGYRATSICWWPAAFCRAAAAR